MIPAVIFGKSPIFFKTVAATGINTTTQVVVRSIITIVLAAALALAKQRRRSCPTALSLTKLYF